MKDNIILIKTSEEYNEVIGDLDVVLVYFSLLG